MPEAEPENRHNEHIISVLSKKSKENLQRMKISGSISDALAKVVDGLVSNWKDFQVIGEVDEKIRVPLERQKCPVVEFRFPRFILCRWQRLMKVTYEKKLNDIKKI